MSVVSSDYCHCGTGYGVLVEVDAGKIARARGERPFRPCRASARKRGRLMMRVRGVLAALANRLAVGTGAAA